MSPRKTAVLPKNCSSKLSSSVDHKRPDTTRQQSLATSATSDAFARQRAADASAALRLKRNNDVAQHQHNKLQPASKKQSDADLIAAYLANLRTQNVGSEQVINRNQLCIQKFKTYLSTSPNEFKDLSSLRADPKQISPAISAFCSTRPGDSLEATTIFDALIGCLGRPDRYEFKASRLPCREIDLHDINHYLHHAVRRHFQSLQLEPLSPKERTLRAMHLKSLAFYLWQTDSEWRLRDYLLPAALIPADTAEIIETPQRRRARLREEYFNSKNHVSSNFKKRFDQTIASVLGTLEKHPFVDEDALPKSDTAVLAAQMSAPIPELAIPRKKRSQVGRPRASQSRPAQRQKTDAHPLQQAYRQAHTALPSAATGNATVLSIASTAITELTDPTLLDD